MTVIHGGQRDARRGMSVCASGLPPCRPRPKLGSGLCDGVPKFGCSFGTLCLARRWRYAPPVGISDFKPLVGNEGVKELIRVVLSVAVVFGLGGAAIYFMTRPAPPNRRQDVEEPASDSLVTEADADGVGFSREPDAAPRRSDDSFDDVLDTFRGVLLGDEREFKAAIKELDESWRPEWSAMAVECFRVPLGPKNHKAIHDLLVKKTGADVKFSNDVRNVWSAWLWSQPDVTGDDYPAFKASFYGVLDPRFPTYFARSPLKKTIRLDEVVWGGVQQDGIPPLDNPKTVAAADASYMADSNVVYGVVINDKARAYPRRVLGWHEMARDVLGGVPINAVYCTLCETMIVYDTRVDAKQYKLGTSGFLYRSNKLMWDQSTNSLWSTVRGEPVIGELADSGLKLKRFPVVTTTWGEWRKRHPLTDVVSLDTGFKRDYTEGAAYKEYYATDKLMFAVSTLDDRLKNKAQVLAIRFGDEEQKLAITAEYLAAHPVYHAQLGAKKFVVLTDASGANRVYESGSQRFESWDGSVVKTEDGSEWKLSEMYLESASGEKLNRLPAHRAFWFGWYSVFPDTQLVK